MQVGASSKSAEDSEPSAESGTQSEADEAEVESHLGSLGVESEASAEPSLQSEAEANKGADSQSLDDSDALDESDADSAVDASSMRIPT